MEQTITPEEQSQAVSDALEAWMHYCKTGERPDIVANNIPPLLDEIKRVRQEALAQGWDEVAALLESWRELGSMNPARFPSKIRECNPHRSHL